MAAHGGALRDQFVDLLLANLDAARRRVPDPDLDPRPPASRAVPRRSRGVDDAAERLARLARDTPVFAAGEASDWLRMHALARDELRRRFALLPADEQAALHARAADWLAAHGLLEAAARHALAAGQREAAYELAERSLYESLMTHGRQGAVLEWLARLPRRRARPPAAPAAGRGLVAGAQRAPRRGQPLRRAHPRPRPAPTPRCAANAR